MTTSGKSREFKSLNDIQLSKLTMNQVCQIDQFLESLGEYGEIRLIVERGVLKYINMIKSHKVVSNGAEDENQTT